MKKLKKRLIIALIAMLFTNPLCYPSSNKDKVKNVEVTYIANDGFLIKVGDKAILIDALFGDKEREFWDIPDKTQIDSMTKSNGVFLNIDLIAATHGHIDHFYAPYIAEHLMNNKNGKFISCKQSIDTLANTENYKEIKNQLIEITPDSLTYKDTTINGIDVRVYRLTHGAYYVYDPNTGEDVNQHRNIQNLGFLFTINGIKILHCGDSNPASISDYEHFRFDKEKIDIVFLGRGFMRGSDTQGIKIIKKYIKPKHVILMHILHDENKRFMDIAKEVKDDLPSVMIFEKQMETKNYVFK